MEVKPLAYPLSLQKIRLAGEGDYAALYSR